MRKRQEQTLRLIRFWVASVVMVFLSLTLSSWSASQASAYRLQEAEVATLTRVICRHLQSGQTLAPPPTWLPDLLSEFDVIDVDIERDGESLYRWHQEIDSGYIREYRRELLGGESLRVTLPGVSTLPGYTLSEWLIILFGLLLAAVAVVLGYGWLSREMKGIEILAARASRVVAGDHDAAGMRFNGERPISAGRALIKLHRLWRQERAAKLELDRQIRANTYLDSELGLGNAAFFDSRLKALTVSGEFKRQGVVILIHFDGLDNLRIPDRVAALRQFVDHCQPLMKEHAESVFARRHWLQLAVLVPGISQKQAETLGDRLQSIAERLMLPKKVSREQLVHIGLAYFIVNERPRQVMEEAEMALRASQLQGHSNWFMYDKGSVDQLLAEGTVRWRTKIENALSKDQILPFYQPIVDVNKNIICQEMFSRMRDTNGELVRASLYRPMASRCGLAPQIERRLLDLGLDQLSDDNRTAVVVNVTVESLIHQRFGKSVAMLLANYQGRRTRLVLEIKEEELVQNADQLAPKLLELKKMGVQLSVDAVGQTVTRTDYIERFDIDWLKLHPSLVRQIQLRPEHQLVVISLVQASGHSRAKLLAEGIESESEWQTLLNLGVQGGQGALFGGTRAFTASAGK